MNRVAAASHPTIGWIALMLLAGITPVAAERLPTSYLAAAPTLSCAGNERIELVDRHLFTTANAISAHGNCQVLLANVHVVAGEIAITATGNAEVVIEHSFVQGTSQAIKVTGNAVVRYRDSTLRGAIFAAAGGTAEHAGGNTIERLPRPVAARLSAAAALRCGDRREILLLHRSIDVPGDAIEVTAGCELTLSDSRLRSGGHGIRIYQGGRVTVRNSVIEAGDGGIVVDEGGFAHVAGSSIHGGVRVAERARLIDGGGNAWEP